MRCQLLMTVGSVQPYLVDVNNNICMCTCMIQRLSDILNMLKIATNWN